MAWSGGLRARLRANLAPRAADAEVEEEFRFHLEMEAERLVREGVEPAEARRRALVAFGGVAQHKERMRAGRGLAWLENALRDARVAVRGLRRSPALLVGALLSLGLAIGVNTAMFSFVNAILYKPLPVPAAERLVGLYVEQNGHLNGRVSRHDYLEYRRRIPSLAGLATESSLPATVRVADSAPERQFLALVSGDYFQVLGLRPHTGRFFLPDEDRAPGAAAIAVVSHHFWRQEMGGDPGVVGRTLTLNRRRFTIVGVAPRGFAGATIPPSALDIFVPATMAGALSGRGESAPPAGGTLLGQMRPGVSMAQVRAEFARAHAELARNAPRAAAGGPGPASVLTGRVTVLAARGAMPELKNSARRFLLMLMALVATTLLVASANVAGLLLARAEARGRELAIQSSLGARRSALVRAFLVESLLLTLPGAVLGFVLALLSRDLLLAFFASPLTMRTALDLSPDVRVVLFALGVTLACALLIGATSALRAGRRDLVQALKGEGRAGSRRALLAGGIVVAQVALAVPLLVVAAAVVHEAERSLHADVGFRVSDVVHATVQLDRATYRDAAARAAFYARLRRELQNDPGVAEAGLMSGPLLASGRGAVVTLPGEAPPRPGLERRVPANAVTPEVLHILNVPPLRGRLLDERDRGGTPPAALVTATLARQLWPGRNAVGRHLRVDDRPYQVVGVVADADFAGDTPVSPYVFLSYAQNPQTAVSTSVLALSRAGDPRALLPVIRRAVAGIDADVPLTQLETLQQERERMSRAPRAIGVLLAISAALALVLAAVGTYALLAFRVARRSRELGVRMALGARSWDLQRLVVRQGVLLVGLGLLLGMPFVPFALRAVGFRLGPGGVALDALFVAGVALVAAALASWLPARRATRVQPASVLRLE